MSAALHNALQHLRKRRETATAEVELAQEAISVLERLAAGNGNGHAVGRPGFRNGVHWTQTPTGRATMRKVALKRARSTT